MPRCGALASSPTRGVHAAAGGFRAKTGRSAAGVASRGRDPRLAADDQQGGWYTRGIDTPTQPRNAANLAVRPYFPELDGVRAIAALMVMAFHFSQGLIYLHVALLGQTGVDLFFVLSGFLISSILLRLPHGSWDGIRRFYLRRVLRIFPLYYGYLIGASLIGGSVSWWYWAYLQNFPLAFGATLHGPSHFWSLAVEEQFYLVWPFLILFLPRRRLAAAMWATILFSTLLRIVLLHTSVSSFSLTFTRLDGLAAGSLLALYYARGQLGRYPWALGLGALASFALMALGAILSNGHGLAWFQVVKFSAATGTYALGVGLLLTTQHTPVHRFLRSRPMRAIGRVSYGLYVFHPAVLDLLVRFGAHIPLPGKLAIYVATTYAIAVISFYGFEKRFTDLKERLAPEKRYAEVQVGSAP